MQSREFKVVIGVLVAGFVVGAVLYSLVPSSKPRFSKEPLLTARPACESRGGYFVATIGACRLPAPDRGKVCRNSSECDGFCEAQLSPDELTGIMKGGKPEKTGICGQWKNPVGCFYTVEGGRVSKTCAD